MLGLLAGITGATSTDRHPRCGQEPERRQGSGRPRWLQTIAGTRTLAMFAEPLAVCPSGRSGRCHGSVDSELGPSCHHVNEFMPISQCSKIFHTPSVIPRQPARPCGRRSAQHALYGTTRPS